MLYASSFCCNTAQHERCYTQISIFKSNRKNIFWSLREPVAAGSDPVKIQTSYRSFPALLPSEANISSRARWRDEGERTISTFLQGLLLVEVSVHCRLSVFVCKLKIVSCVLQYLCVCSSSSHPLVKPCLVTMQGLKTNYPTTNHCHCH